MTRTLNTRPGLAGNRLECRTVPAFLINELYVNPPGIDDNREFVEILSTTGGAETSLAGIALVEVGGNPLVAGKILSDVHLSGVVTGQNGLLLLGENYASLGTPWGAQVSGLTSLGDLTSKFNNDNFTLLLVEGYTGAVGQDLDVNDDGVLDSTPWTGVLDSIGWYDPSVPGGHVYTSAVVAPPALTPDAAVRFNNDGTKSSKVPWFAGEMVTTGGVPDMTQTFNLLQTTSNAPAGAAITPGAANPANPAGVLQVAGVTVNQGDAQRSRVTSITVTFNQTVTLPADPASGFRMTRQSDGAVVALAATHNTNTVTLTFIGGPVESGSLADGRYTLTVRAGLVSGSVTSLDGNANGTAGDDYTLVGDTTNKLFRLFGDSDGDGTVNSTDFLAFRLAFLTPSAAFDHNGTGSVDSSDFLQFRLRFLMSV
ncbi:MAG: hypothetical protein K1X57_05745 [Gemmataceae bacterium]|nr:hypothetical protein [Gemmataceae bacterium]